MRFLADIGASMSAVAECAELLVRGAIVTIEDHGYRVRPLPIGVVE